MMDAVMPGNKRRVAEVEVNTEASCSDMFTYQRVSSWLSYGVSSITMHYSIMYFTFVCPETAQAGLSYNIIPVHDNIDANYKNSISRLTQACAYV
jgi:hypothetical protein